MTALEECYFSRLPLANTVTHCPVVEPKLSAPVCKGINLTSILNHLGIPAIVGLFFFGCPSAVGQLVVAVIVDSIYGMFRGGFHPHIGNKIGEIEPPFAHGNAPSSVKIVRRIIRPKATASHVPPNGVLGRLVLSVSGNSFNVETSTRPRVVINELCCDDGNLGTAITTAKPSTFGLSVSEVTQNGQSEEFLAGEVSKPVVFGERNDYEFGSVIHGLNMSALGAVLQHQLRTASFI